MADETIAALIAHVPDLDADGTLTGPTPAEAYPIFDGCLAQGATGITTLIDRLKAVDNGEDYRERYVLHGLAVRLRDPGFEAQRALFNGVLAAEASGARNPAIRGFLVRQLQVCGTRTEIPALTRLLADADLCEYAAQAILAIGDGAGDAFRSAFGRIPKTLRLTIVQGLVMQQQSASAPALRQAARDADADVRLIALLGLARIADRTAIDLLLENAGTEGNNRTIATNACLEMAENLIAAKNAPDALRIYRHLYQTRTDPAEQVVRDVAQAGMMSAGFRDPTPPTPPANLTCKTISGSALLLTWSPSTDPDSGIWQYSVTRDDVPIAVAGPGTGGSIEAVDADVKDGVTYTYRVRAVNLGKTESAPTELRTRFLDTVAPRLLTATCYANEPDHVRVTFSKPMDKQRLGATGSYRLSVGGSVKTVTLSQDLDAVQLQLATPLAEGDKVSLTLTGLTDQTVKRNPLANAVIDFTVVNRRPGIRYACYEAVLGDPLEAYLKATPAKTGITEKVDVSVRTRDDQFSLKFDGIIEIPVDGEYTFYTSSDDGSRLYIHGEPVVRNDGLHGPEEKAGTIRLPAGGHPITVTFFEEGGGEVITASWQGPGIDKQEIPAEVLFHIPE